MKFVWVWLFVDLESLICLQWLQSSESKFFFLLAGSEMEEEQRDMKAHKAYYDMLDFVANAQQGIPKLCPCGSITKEFVDEEDTYDYLPGKRYFICKDYQVWSVLDIYLIYMRLSIFFFHIYLLFGKYYFVLAEWRAAFQATMGYGCARRGWEAQSMGSRAWEPSERVRGT